MKKHISISVIILAVFCVGVYCKINDVEIKKKSEEKVYSDIEFVKSKFPKIEEIESVSYDYTSNSFVGEFYFVPSSKQLIFYGEY